MGRIVNLDARKGGASAQEILFGEIEVQPTMLRHDGTVTVLPAPSRFGISNGKAILDMAPSPAGPEPAWAYKAVLRDMQSGRAWSELIGVPTGSGAIGYPDLPRFVGPEIIPPETTVPMMQNWAATTEDNAQRSEEAAERAEAPTDQMNKTLIENSASLTHKALDITAAGLIEEPGSTLGTSVKNSIVQGTYTVTARVDATGTSNAKPAIQNAVYATPAGGTLIIPEGDYLLQGAASINNWTSATDQTPKSIHIKANGARFICDGTFALAFGFVGGFETIQQVSQVTRVDLPSDNTVFATFQPGITLKLASSAPEWKRGDVVRVFADDAIPDARPESGGSVARVGQYLTVHSISGQTVTLLGTLVDPYTTNIRAARLRAGISVSIEGATFTISDSRYADETKIGFVGFTALMAPIAKDITIERANAAMIIPTGCYKPEVAGLTIGYALDDPAVDGFGYGIVDKSSSFGNYHGLRGRNVRHLFTTDMPRFPSGGLNPHAYGRTWFAHVHSSSGDGASNAAFDSHHGAYGTRFTDCDAINCWTGFQMRGQYESISGGRGNFNKTDIRVFSESAGGDTRGALIDRFRSTGARDVVFRIELRPSGHPQSGVREVVPVHIKNPTISQAGGALVDALNGTVVVSSPTFEPGPELKNASSVFQSANSQVTVTGSAILDYTANSSGTGLSVASLTTGTSSTFEVFGQLILRNYSAARLATFLINGESAIVRVDRVRVVGSLPAKMYTKFASSGYFVYDAPSFYGDNSATLTLANEAVGTPGDVLQKIAATTDPFFLLMLQPGSNRTLAELPPALNRGQRLHIANGSSSGSVTVRNGAPGNTVLRSNSDKVIAPGQSLELVWTNESRWRQTAPVG